MIKRYFILIASILLFISCNITEPDCPEPGQTIIASFNGSEITQAEFNDRFFPDGKVILGENSYTLKLELLKTLINEKLILSEASELGISVDPEEIESHFNDQFYQTPPTDSEKIKRLKTGIETQLIIEKFISRKFGDINITDEELKEYYNENSGQFYETEEFGVYQIFVTSGALADDLHTRLKKGSDFQKLAIEHNSPPHDYNADKVEVYKKGDLPPEFEAAVMKLKRNRFTDVIKSSYGFHIFKLNYKKTAHVRTFDDAKESIRKQLTEIEIEKKFNHWLRAERARHEIKINRKFLEQ